MTRKAMTAAQKRYVGIKPSPYKKNGQLRKNASVNHFAMKSNTTQKQREARENSDSVAMIIVISLGLIITAGFSAWNWITSLFL